MRRIIIAVLMTGLLISGGCSGAKADEEAVAGLRSRVAQAECVTLTALISADYDADVAAYTLLCVRTGGSCEMTVLSPELIAGVTARAAAGSLELEYDGAVLAAGALSEDGLDPVSFVPAMLDAFADGHLEQVWREGDCLAVKLLLTESAVLTLWLDAGSLTPIRAEAVCGGRRVIDCQISDFSID